MIDIEAAEFTKVKAAIVAAYSTCNCVTVSADTPTTFPTMLFSQKDDPVYKQSIDSGSKENHVQPMIQIDVFTTDTMLKAKQIMAVADTAMQADGWERTFGPQPLSLVSPFRIVCRYQAIVKQNAPNNFTVI
jgi:hypothetical protein